MGECSLLLVNGPQFLPLTNPDSESTDVWFQNKKRGVLTNRITELKVKTIMKVIVTYMFIVDPVLISLLAAIGCLF